MLSAPQFSSTVLARLMRLVVASLALTLFATAAAACGSSDVVTDVAADTSDAETDTNTASDGDEAADDAEAMGDDAYPVSIATASGDVTIDAMPARIVSLSPTATEMLFAVGAGAQVVAVDDYSNYPSDAPMTDLSGFAPNVEAISGFEPDLLVTQGPIEGIEVLDVPVLVQSAAASLDDVYAQIEQIGAATGHVGEAAEVVGNMQAEIEEIIASVPPSDEPLTYFHELGTELYTATSSTFIGSVYSMLGLENIADPADADGASFGYPQLSEEFIVDADPDIIFLADTIGYGQDASTVAERPGWDSLAAVQAGNIVELNDDVASRWGPRIVEFIAAAADAISNVSVGASN